jgi:hypothetical protein
MGRAPPLNPPPSIEKKEKKEKNDKNECLV